MNSKSLIFSVLVYFCFLLNCSFLLCEIQLAKDTPTQTPIKYLVVIIPENRTFDHLFGIYPNALNPSHEPYFKAKWNTPIINGLTQSIIKHNTNLIPPFRLSRYQVATIEPAHHYTQLQMEAHGGLLDRFIQLNSNDPSPMGYYDGNTVTALWNYAQRFAMSDNCFSTTMTPSAPGHINIVSGLTHHAVPENLILEDSGEIVVIDGTLIGDPDPAFDMCSKDPKVEMTGKNVGDLLNAKNITWGYFQGGFRDCKAKHIGNKGKYTFDYSPHHQPFQYYKSTSNPKHLPPSSLEKIGFQDQANHQYDLMDFWSAAEINQIPAVSFLKPAEYQDGHPKYSNQLLLQEYLVETINKLQQLEEWKQMAVIIVWDDCGGWYDHVMPPIIQQSHTEADAFLGPGDAGNPPLGAYQARFGYGMRIPFLLISRFAKPNFVDHTLIDQTSVLKFIEMNWNLGSIGDQSFDEIAGSILNMFDFISPKDEFLFLDPQTGLKRTIVKNN